MTLAVIVAWPDDKLAGAVAESFRDSGRSWVWLPPATLASVDVTIADGRLRLGDEVVETILWRALPRAQLAVEFAPEDRIFADTEARAFWVAALNLPTLASTFRPDAGLFFARSSWSYWRDLLGHHGVSLAPLRLGGVPDASWLPYAASEPIAAPSAIACRMLGAPTLRKESWTRVAFAGVPPTAVGPVPAAAEAALTVLCDAGLRLGTLLATEAGVLCVNATPKFDDPMVIHALLPSLMRTLNDSADRR